MKNIPYEQEEDWSILVEEGRPVRRFEDLVVWQLSHRFVLEVYGLSATFPQTERFGLVSQIRRAAVSVPSNIAEGFGRTSLADKKRFAAIALGSLNEARYYLILAADLGYSETTSLQEDADRLARMLNTYGQRMKGLPPQ